MIRKQYRRGRRGYFDNFITSIDLNSTAEAELKLYDATIAKSKNKHYIMNVKWRNPELYIIFVLRYS